MTASLMLVGKLPADPQEATTKTNKPWVKAALTLKSGEQKLYVLMGIFDETAMAEILRHRQGDEIAVVGTPDFSIYEPKDGSERRVGIRLTVHRVLSHIPMKSTPAPRVKSTPAVQERMTLTRQTTSRTHSDLDDDIGF